MIEDRKDDAQTEEEVQEITADPEDLEQVISEALEAVEHSGEEAAPAADEEPPLSEVDRLQSEMADLRDRAVRTLADFDNYRKRTERERADERRYAAFEMSKEFITIVDNLERALEAGGESEDLRAGVELILRQAREMLSHFGVERIEALGERFDPLLHDAVARQEDPAVTEPRVSQMLLPGYLMYDRLLRPATVAVAVPVEGSGNGEAEGESDG